MVATTTIAINGGQLVWKTPWNWTMPKGRVQCSSPGPKKTAGQKSPFHVPWNCRIATAASAGPASGRMTFQKVWKWPAPSIRAASSRSRGMPRKYWRSRKIEVALIGEDQEDAQVVGRVRLGEPEHVHDLVDGHEAQLVRDHQRREDDDEDRPRGRESGGARRHSRPCEPRNRFEIDDRRGEAQAVDEHLRQPRIHPLQTCDIRLEVRAAGRPIVECLGPILERGDDRPDERDEHQQRPRRSAACRRCPGATAAPRLARRWRRGGGLPVVVIGPPSPVRRLAEEPALDDREGHDDTSRTIPTAAAKPNSNCSDRRRYRNRTMVVSEFAGDPSLRPR